MQNNSVLQSNNISTDSLSEVIIDSIQDIKGKNILKLDLRHIDDAPTDFFIICEGDSVTQVNAIAGNISRRVKDECGIRHSRLEGMANAKWVLVDYFDIVVHVFYPETRKYYELEDLWLDAKSTEYQNL